VGCGRITCDHVHGLEPSKHVSQGFPKLQVPQLNRHYSLSFQWQA
jgi:hypothetical protein